MSSAKHNLFIQILHRAALGATVVALATSALTAAAQPATWPNKPTKLIVPYPPGGAADIVACIFAQRLTDSLKQSVVVENKPSLVPTGQLTVLPHITKDIRVDTFNSFTPVAQLAYTGVVIAAGPNIPVHNLKEFIALAKSKPGQLTYSSSGSGTNIHLAGEYFALASGTTLLHIPFEGSAPAVAALLGNEVNLAFDTLAVLAPQISGGRIKGLAITSAKRSALLPEVPTAAEAGLPGYEISSWFGVVVPAATPRDIVTQLNNELTQIAREGPLKERFVAQGIDTLSSTTEGFAKAIREDHLRWGRIMQTANINLE